MSLMVTTLSLSYFYIGLILCQLPTNTVMNDNIEINSFSYIKVTDNIILFPMQIPLKKLK